MNVLDIQQKTVILLFFYSISSQRENITPQASVLSPRFTLWIYYPNTNSCPPTGPSKVMSLVISITAVLCKEGEVRIHGAGDMWFRASVN